MWRWSMDTKIHDPCFYYHKIKSHYPKFWVFMKMRLAFEPVDSVNFPPTVRTGDYPILWRAWIEQKEELICPFFFLSCLTIWARTPIPSSPAPLSGIFNLSFTVYSAFKFGLKYTTGLVSGFWQEIVGLASFQNYIIQCHTDIYFYINTYHISKKYI